MWPAASLTGDTVIDMSTSRPSSVTRTVSKWSTRPASDAREHVVLFARRSSGTMSVMFGPHRLRRRPAEDALAAVSRR